MLPTDSFLTHNMHHRPPIGKDEKFLPAPIAEHGFSALIETEVNNNTQSASVQRNAYLFDAGTSENGVVLSLIYWELTSKTLMPSVLSHGRFDHFTGLQSVAKRILRPIKLYAHPDAFLKRWDIFAGWDKADKSYPGSYTRKTRHDCPKDRRTIWPSRRKG